MHKLFLGRQKYKKEVKLVQIVHNPDKFGKDRTHKYSELIKRIEIPEVYHNVE